MSQILARARARKNVRRDRKRMETMKSTEKYIFYY